MANCFNDSVWDGMTLDQLQAALIALQQAYLQLLGGSKAVSASYAQGDGARSVTYTQANQGDLVQGILGLQKKIADLQGYTCNRRAPLAPFF
jgi:hypothetical protein